MTRIHLFLSGKSGFVPQGNANNFTIDKLPSAWDHCIPPDQLALGDCACEKRLKHVVKVLYLLQGCEFKTFFFCVWGGGSMSLLFHFVTDALGFFPCLPHLLFFVFLSFLSAAVNLELCLLFCFCNQSISSLISYALFRFLFSFLFLPFLSCRWLRRKSWSYKPRRDLWKRGWAALTLWMPLPSPERNFCCCRVKWNSFRRRTTGMNNTHS